MNKTHAIITGDGIQMLLTKAEAEIIEKEVGPPYLHGDIQKALAKVSNQISKPKTLRDFDPSGLSVEYFVTAAVGGAWPEILMRRVSEVFMDDEEFRCFCMFFLAQFPHDWDGKSFMNVKISRIENKTSCVD